MFAYSPNFLAESPSVETLRELEEYIDAAISGPQHNAPELKLCYHSHSSSTALSSLDNNNSSGSGAADSSLDTRQFQDGRSDQLRVPDGKLIAGMQWLLVSLALMVSNFLYGMNATMIGNAQLFITEEFGEVAKLGWIGVSFALGATISVLPLSKAMNVFDNKWLCINCLGMYAAAVGLCGGAPSMNVAIIGRIWAGATGTGLFMMTTNLFATLTLSDKNSWYKFTTTSIVGAGCIIGPVVSGLLCESKASWRWIFYIQLIVLGLLSPIYIFLLPSLPKQTETPYLTKLQRLDWLGILLLAAVLTSFAVATTCGGSLYAWSSPRTIATLALSAISISAFFATQYKLTCTTSSERLFPTSPLCTSQLVLLFFTTASASAALLISIYYIPVHFLYVFGDDANIGALRVIPFVSFWWWLLVVCGAVLPKIGYHGVWYLFSGLCLTAGGATMYTVRASTTPQTIAGFMVLYILGLLTSEAQYSIGVEIIAVNKGRKQQNVTEVEVDEMIGAEVGEMTRFFGFAQALGGLIGLAVASAVFQNGAFSDLNKTLHGQNLTKAQVQSAITGVRSDIWKYRPDAKLRALWLNTLVKNVDNVWMIVAVTGGLYTLSAYCMSRKRFAFVTDI